MSIRPGPCLILQQISVAFCDKNGALQMLDMLEDHFGPILGPGAVERIDITTPSAQRHNIIQQFNQPRRCVHTFCAVGKSYTPVPLKCSDCNVPSQRQGIFHVSVSTMLFVSRPATTVVMSLSSIVKRDVHIQLTKSEWVFMRAARAAFSSWLLEPAA